MRDVVRDGTGRIVGVVAREDGMSTTLRSRLVIGADGLRSVIARRTGLGSHGAWPRRIAFVRHYRGIRHDCNVGDMHVFAGGYAGFAPVGGGLTNVALVIPTRRSGEIGTDRNAFMQRELMRHDRIAARLATADPATPVRAVGPFNWRARRAWLPGAALVGDAADFFDPFTGEGMYAAMRGAELLTAYAWEAARATRSRDAEVALAAYDRCRRHEFAGKWAVERAIAAAVASPVLINRAARALARRPDLANTLVGVTGDFVPPGEVLGPGYILSLLVAASRYGGRARSLLSPGDYQVAEQ